MIALPAGHLARLLALRAHLHSHGARGWLVGGYVRDLLLGRPGGDIDIAVAGDAPALARSFADMTAGAWVLLDQETGTARVVWPAEPSDSDRPRTIDIVRLRAATIDGDLRGRDFTINALALPFELIAEWHERDLLDPLDGLPDLRRGRLRACSPTSIVDDPLRMLRAVRLAGQLNFHLADELEAELRRRRALIGSVSAERVRDELLRILALPGAGGWVNRLDDLGLLTAIIPELEPARSCDQPRLHYLPVLGHLLEAVVAADWLIGQLRPDAGQDEGAVLPDAVWAHPELVARLPYADRLAARFEEPVDGVPRAALYKLSVLLHDVAKPRTKATKPDGGISFYDHQTIGAEIAWTIARRLRLSRAGSDYVRRIVREHMRPGQLNELGPALSMRAVYRFFAATEDAGPDVLLHSLCDHLAMQGPGLSPAGWSWHVAWTAEMIETFYGEETVIRPEPIVRGDDLMRELDLPPGPLIGRLLADVREAQAAGEIHTREDALAWARRAASASTSEGGGA